MINTKIKKNTKKYSYLNSIPLYKLEVLNPKYSAIANAKSNAVVTLRSE